MDDDSDKIVFDWWAKQLISMLCISQTIWELVLFLQFPIHCKKIDKSNIRQTEKQAEIKSKLWSLIKLECYSIWSSWSIKSTPPILLLYNLMPFGKFTGWRTLPTSLHGWCRCYSFKWLPSSITDILSYHLLQTKLL